MNYILKYFIKSKYIGFMKKQYIEFEKIGNLIKFIKDNNIYDFTIYQKCDNLNIEVIKND